MERNFFAAKVFYWVVLIFLICSADAFGEDEITMEKIVVTPTRVESDYQDSSREVNIITSGQIDDAVATDTSELLTNLPSTNITDYGGIGSTKNIRMRGSSAAQVLVMIDGRPVNNPRDGTVDLTTLPMDDIRKIEVLRGPASSLYGSAAMGGVVNIITKNPPKTGFQTEVNSGYGKFGSFAERLSQGGKIGRFGYIVNGGYISTEGFRTNSEFSSKDFNSKLQYALTDDMGLSFNCGYYKDHSGTPGLIDAPTPEDKQDSRKDFMDLKWEFKPTKTVGFMARTYNNYDRLEFNQKSLTPAAKYIHATNTRGFGTQYNQEFGGIYQLVVGYDHVGNFNDSTTSAKHEYDVNAGFIENKLTLIDKLDLGLGLRVDDYSNFGATVNPNFNAGYRFNKDNKAHFLVSSSFRAPTFNDLYWPRTDYWWGGTWFGAEEGNPNLKPEKGITIEAGMDSRINRFLSGGLTYYHNIFDELINWAELDSVWSPTNVGTAIIDGLELESTLSPLTNLDLNFCYTFLRAKNELTNKYLTYQPRGKYDLSLIYKGLAGFTFQLKGQYTGLRFHDAANLIKVKSFMTLNLDISKKINKDITCYLSFKNLQDKKYQVIKDYPAAGFSVDGSLKAEF